MHRMFSRSRARHFDVVLASHQMQQTTNVYIHQSWRRRHTPYCRNTSTDVATTAEQYLNASKTRLAALPMRRTPETYSSTGVPALVSHTSHPPESRQLHPLKGASGVASAKASVLPSQASDRETEVRRARNTRQQQRLWGAVRSGWVVGHAWISRILGRTYTYDTVQQQRLVSPVLAAES